MTNEEEVSENHVEEEDEEKITTKPGKPARSGRRGGTAIEFNMTNNLF